MKKNIILALACLSFLFFVSCGTGTASSEADAEATDIDNSNNNNGDAETEISKKEDIFGVITEIVGNLGTITLAVMPDDGVPVPQDTAFAEFDLNNLPTDENGELTIPEGMQGRAARVNDGEWGERDESGRAATVGQGAFSGITPDDVRTFISDGELPEGMTLPEGVNLEDIQQRMGEGGFIRGAGGGGGRVFLEYKEEEIEFIFPIGFPIFALTRDEEGNDVETEIELADIQSGNVLNVVYKDDGKTIDKIIISQVSAENRAEISERLNMINPNIGDDANGENENIDNTDGE